MILQSVLSIPKKQVYTLIVSIIVLAIIAIITCDLIIIDLNHKSEMKAQQAEMSAEADTAVYEHIWDREDYFHWDSIVKQSYVGLSDRDFDWLLSKMTEQTPPSGIDQKTVDTLVIGEFCDAGLTLSQRERADTGALPFLKKDNEPGDSVGLIPEYACKLFEKYPDKRAVPDLFVLVNSAHPWVRRHAALALVSLGYGVPVPPKPTSW